MKSAPLVSVIIPTYNRAAVVGAAIESVLDQTYRDFEVIVVDDGSTDETPATLNRYADRIRVVRQTNAGAAAARNRGIAASRSALIAFQDSDDLWLPHKLERQVALMQRAGPLVPCCLSNIALGPRSKSRTTFDLAQIHSPFEAGLWLNVAEVLATRFVLFNQAVLIRRAALDKVGVFDSGLKYLEDYDLPLRLALEGPWAFIREPLVIYREGAQNSYSQQALRDPITLKDCELRIFTDILERLRKQGGDPAVEWQLEHRLRVFRRGRFIAKLLCRPAAARVLGKILWSLDHSYFALFRRSPWYPEAITRLVTQAPAPECKPDMASAVS